MTPLGKAGSPQDTLTEVVVSSLKWMKLGALGAAAQGDQRPRVTLGTAGTPEVVAPEARGTARHQLGARATAPGTAGAFEGVFLSFIRVRIRSFVPQMCGMR